MSNNKSTALGSSHTMPINKLQFAKKPTLPNPNPFINIDKCNLLRGEKA